MRKNLKGLTLLEVMIALFIFSLMISAVFPVLITSRMSGLSSKAFGEARQLAQSELEKIYGYSQTLAYSDGLYQIITQDAFSCSGFGWTTDLLTGEIIYSTPSNPVTCIKVVENYRINMTLSQNTSVNDPMLKDILIQIHSINVIPEVKRYETLYATNFRP